MNDQRNMEMYTMTDTTLMETAKRVRVEEDMEANAPRAIAQGAMVLKGERVVPFMKGVSLTIVDDELDFDVDALLKELAKMKVGGKREVVEITEYDSNGSMSKKEEIVKMNAPKLMRPASEWNEAFFRDVLTYCEFVPNLKEAKQMNDEAKCTFVHPDGTLVTLMLPLSRILYVPQYKKLVEAFNVDLHWVPV